MLTPDELDKKFIRMNKAETIKYLMSYNFLLKEMRCSFCNSFMNLTKYKKNKDGVAWRCNTASCNYYQEYFSIRINSFFENFSADLGFIIRVIIKYLTKQQIFSILDYFRVNKSLIYKIINKFKLLIPTTDYSNNILGGPGMIVQIDESMLNFKAKSHRGRSPDNKTDCISIVECTNEIVRAYPKIIPNKESSTILPIITSHLANNSVIWTDEHLSYSRLS
ncbi:hypothetical protein H311_02473 [Anncaliia algerae PRA109]|nr:hypothetical protein H311_02473 [Anncaliia algerae PRA109]